MYELKFLNASVCKDTSSPDVGKVRVVFSIAEPEGKSRIKVWTEHNGLYCGLKSHSGNCVKLLDNDDEIFKYKMMGLRYNFCVAVVESVTNNNFASVHANPSDMDFLIESLKTLTAELNTAVVVLDTAVDKEREELATKIKLAETVAEEFNANIPDVANTTYTLPDVDLSDVERINIAYKTINNIKNEKAKSFIKSIMVELYNMRKSIMGDKKE